MVGQLDRAGHAVPLSPESAEQDRGRAQCRVVAARIRHVFGGPIQGAGHPSGVARSWSRATASSDARSVEGDEDADRAGEPVEVVVPRLVGNAADQRLADPVSQRELGGPEGPSQPDLLQHVRQPAHARSACRTHPARSGPGARSARSPRHPGAPGSAPTPKRAPRARDTSTDRTTPARSWHTWSRAIRLRATTAVAPRPPMHPAGSRRRQVVSGSARETVTLSWVVT